MTELKDWLNSINQTKKNIMDEDPSSTKEYAPYIINRCLSGHIDCLMYANEMNKYSSLDKKLQYDFFINTIRKKKRFSPWLKQEKIKDLEVVKSYYGYSNEKAKQALNILTKEQLDFIKSKLETGGTK
jgi:Bacteriophage clamp loader A subunit